MEALSNSQPAALVGILPGNAHSPLDARPDASSTPSILIKALAKTFARFLSVSNDLGKDRRAVFVAGPNQAGIPGGNLVPAAVTNYQVFLKADAVQRINNPEYSVDGAGSYYSFLSMYMRYILEGNEDPDIRKARKGLLLAESVKDKAYEKARQKHMQQRHNNPQSTETFAETLEQNKDYVDAYDAEQAAEMVYTSLLDPLMQDIVLQLKLVKAANDRVDFKRSNNMPCEAMSQDYIYRAYLAGKPITSDPRDIYYRPLYSLPDYDHICNNWSNSSTSLEDQVYPISLDPKSLQATTWASLGHPALDQASPVTLTATQAQLWSQATATITFKGKPAVVDVARGMWDVNTSLMPKLSPSAPAEIRQPFVETTKLLLAWGLEIKLKFPKDAVPLLVDEDNSMWGVPFQISGADPTELRFTAGGQFYPILVAALGSLVGGT